MSNFIITDLLYKHKLLNEKLKIIDCGAWGSSFQDWHSLHDKLTIYGFDPDKNECERLNTDARAKGLDHHYFILILSQGKKRREVSF